MLLPPLPLLCWKLWICGVVKHPLRAAYDRRNQHREIR
uniref:Uncharacterized protein n=1 Tax=Timema shepardi TaxID=629360 RepID=A0A7R9B5M1_TIMSH|nr:unnamed protein product [Timema shepardi]